MALRPCTVCGRATKGSRCPAHRPRNGSTRSWRQLRAGVLFRDTYTCVLCGAGASEVDHITPLAYGGSDEPSNLRALCAACHVAEK